MALRFGGTLFSLAVPVGVVVGALGTLEPGFLLLWVDWAMRSLACKICFWLAIGERAVRRGV